MKARGGHFGQPHSDAGHRPCGGDPQRHMQRGSVPGFQGFCRRSKRCFLLGKEAGTPPQEPSTAWFSAKQLQDTPVFRLKIRLTQDTGRWSLRKPRSCKEEAQAQSLITPILVGSRPPQPPKASPTGHCSGPQDRPLWKTTLSSERYTDIPGFELGSSGER